MLYKNDCQESLWLPVLIEVLRTWGNRILGAAGRFYGHLNDMYMPWRETEERHASTKTGLQKQIVRPVVHRLEQESMCTERDIIYGLKCTEYYEVVYVGEMGRQLKERIEKHLRDIRLIRDKPAATHFNSSKHSINNVQFSVLERVHGQSKVLRLIREIE